MENERGRELKASELKPETVVLIKPPGKEVLITMWVRSVHPEAVEFYSGVMKWHVVNFVTLEDTLVDDQRRDVHVYEYLGEI